MAQMQGFADAYPEHCA